MPDIRGIPSYNVIKIKLTRFVSLLLETSHTENVTPPPPTFKKEPKSTVIIVEI
jgi:hypothetical protein